MTTPGADGLRRDQPAGFWRRICAGFFDVVFLVTAALVLFLEILVAVPVAMRSSSGTLDSAEFTALWAVLALVWCGTSVILLPGLYYTLTEGAYGQTFGKALFRIVVVSADGQPIGYGRAFARLLTIPYALLPIGLGLLWAALPPAKRAWHDYISATRVDALVWPAGLQTSTDQDEAIASPRQ